MLSDLQKRNVTRFFNLYDLNGNGFITQDEPEDVIKALAKIRGLEEGTEGFDSFREGFLIYWNGTISAANANQDDKITLEEWLTAHEKILTDAQTFQETVIASAQYMFDLMDLDGDGKITMDEYGKWMEAFRIKGDKTEVFEKLDVNGSGEVTMTEMAHLIQQFYFSDNPDDPGHWALGTPE